VGLPPGSPRRRQARPRTRRWSSRRRSSPRTTPAGKRNPIYLFYSDGFQKPYPFDPIIAIDFDEVAQKKWDCIGDMPSQFADADSWQARYRGNAPADPAGARRAHSRPGTAAQRRRGQPVRPLLVKLYGDQKGGRSSTPRRSS
jgi:hypothetical protein